MSRRTLLNRKKKGAILLAPGNPFLYESLSWPKLRAVASERGLLKRGMGKLDIIAALEASS